jgi:hypothetical protein
MPRIRSTLAFAVALLLAAAASPTRGVAAPSTSTTGPALSAAVAAPHLVHELVPAATPAAVVPVHSTTPADAPVPPEPSRRRSRIASIDPVLPPGHRELLRGIAGVGASSNLRSRPGLAWHVRQLLPLTYRSRYTDGSGQRRYAVWRMWMGRVFDYDDVALAPA